MEEREHKEISDETHTPEQAAIWYLLNENFQVDETEFTMDDKKDEATLASAYLKKFYSRDMKLIEFFEFEAMLEYEKCIRSIFTKERELKPLQLKTNINSLSKAPFHQVVLSAILNQCTFMRETLHMRKERELSRYKKVIEDRKKLDEKRAQEGEDEDMEFQELNALEALEFDEKSDTTINNMYRKLNHKLVEHLTTWINQIDSNNYVQQLPAGEERQIATSITQLLDNCAEQWKEY